MKENISIEIKLLVHSWNAVLEIININQHQQNACVESLIDKLLNFTWAIMNNIECSLKYWLKIFCAQIYLWEQKSHVILNKMTSFEIWHDHQSDVSHIRILWFKVHILDLSKRRKKLNDTHTIIDYFIEFNDEINKLYEILLSSENIVTVHNVTVIENHCTRNFKISHFDFSLESVMNMINFDSVTDTVTVITLSINICSKDSIFDVRFDISLTLSSSVTTQDIVEFESETHNDETEFFSVSVSFSELNTSSCFMSAVFNSSDLSNLSVCVFTCFTKNNLFQHFILVVITLKSKINSEIKKLKTLRVIKEDWNWNKWFTDMQEKYDSLIENHIWDLINSSFTAHMLCRKWVYKLKKKSNEKILHHKTHWVVWDFE